MVPDDVRDALARRTGPVDAGAGLAGLAAFSFPPLGAPPSTQPLSAEVTRRRLRVNFRQRYESRGVDRYRKSSQPPAQVSHVAVSILR